MTDRNKTGGLRLYNSLTRRKEDFTPIDPKDVRLYVCGPTVYDYAHVGNARPVVVFDLLFRVLRHLYGADHVTYARNITDIDDKIIRRAVERNVPIRTLTEFFIAAMRADEQALGVQAPDAEPRATEHVGGMLELIARLEERGLAYRGPHGDVHFPVRKFPGYGKLSGKSLDDLRAGERIAVTADKQDPLDFVLWKAAKPEEPADAQFPSPYGAGRPGWHIECSAMSHALLGMPLDIHGGGPDLKFPHHENEIAQSEGAWGGTLAGTWMHCGPMMVDTEKMSKSLGNFQRIRDTLAVDADDTQAQYTTNPREAEMLRFFLLRSHYRSELNYAPDNLRDAQHALDRLYQALRNVAPQSVEIHWDTPAAQRFKAAMDDDFNTAEAIAVLFELATQANRDHDPHASGLLRALGGVLGLLQADPATYLQAPSRYAAAHSHAASDLSVSRIEALVAERTQAKADKNYARADAIRHTLQQHGIELADGPDGTRWRRA